MAETTKHDPISLKEGPVQTVPAPEALTRLLEEWMQGDEADQRETFELLRRSLDQDRPQGYKLFPPS